MEEQWNDTRTDSVSGKGVTVPRRGLTMRKIVVELVGDLEVSRRGPLEAEELPARGLVVNLVLPFRAEAHGGSSMPPMVLKKALFLWFTASTWKR